MTDDFERVKKVALAEAIVPRVAEDRMPNAQGSRESGATWTWGEANSTGGSTRERPGSAFALVTARRPVMFRWFLGIGRRRWWNWARTEAARRIYEKEKMIRDTVMERVGPYDVRRYGKGFERRYMIVRRLRGESARCFEVVKADFIMFSQALQEARRLEKLPARTKPPESYEWMDQYGNRHKSNAVVIPDHFVVMDRGLVDAAIIIHKDYVGRWLRGVSIPLDKVLFLAKPKKEQS